MTRHVLVIDDDLDIREAIAEILEEHGATVTTAVNGQDGLEKLRAGPRPDVVLLDLMMPVLDGRAFCERVRSEPELAGLRIVVLSAYREVEELARELGVVSVMPKPLDLPKLVELVERHSRSG
jgi:CheY-like chemotaxis protein